MSPEASGDWRRVGTTVLQLSELGTGGVRLLEHQITNPPEQRRVVLLVTHKRCSYYLKRSERHLRPYKSAMGALANQIVSFPFFTDFDNACDDRATLAVCRLALPNVIS